MANPHISDYRSSGRLFATTSLAIYKTSPPTLTDWKHFLPSILSRIFLFDLIISRLHNTHTAFFRCICRGFAGLISCGGNIATVWIENPNIFIDWNGSDIKAKAKNGQRQPVCLIFIFSIEQVFLILTVLLLTTTSVWCRFEIYQQLDIGEYYVEGIEVVMDAETRPFSKILLPGISRWLLMLLSSWLISCSSTVWNLLSTIRSNKEDSFPGRHTITSLIIFI